MKSIYSSNGGRILKVLVAKMCLDEDDGSGDASPPKRPNVEDAPKKKSPKRRTINSSGKAALARDGSPSKNLTRFDAPSPNGSTDSRVIVLLVHSWSIKRTRWNDYSSKYH